MSVHRRSPYAGAMAEPLALERLVAGQVVIVGGDRYVTVGNELADAFAAGDRLIALGDTGDLLHVPAAQYAIAAEATARPRTAFEALGEVDDDQISTFFDGFAARLGDDDVSEHVLTANRADVEAAERSGRSTTRLVLTDSMRRDMVAGLIGLEGLTASARRPGRDGRTRRVARRRPPCPARCRRVRLRGPSQRLRRRRWRGAQRQHGGDAHRVRRVRPPPMRSSSAASPRRSRRRGSRRARSS